MSTTLLQLGRALQGQQITQLIPRAWTQPGSTHHLVEGIAQQPVLVEDEEPTLPFLQEKTSRCIMPVPTSPWPFLGALEMHIIWQGSVKGLRAPAHIAQR